LTLERYNEIGELLIENRTTGSQDMYAIGTEAGGYLVTMAAVHMRVEETGM